MSTLRVLSAPLCRGQPHLGVMDGPDAVRRFLRPRSGLRVLPPPVLGRRGVWPQCAALRDHLIPLLVAARQDPILVVGGDHSLSAGTVAATRTVYPTAKVLWIDAHADVNTPTTSETGNAHGMPVAMLTGRVASQFECLDPSDLIYLGLRDVDAAEAEWIDQQRGNGMLVFTAHDVASQGMATIMHAVRAAVGSSPVHVSFDVDVVDPTLAPAPTQAPTWRRAPTLRRRRVVACAVCTSSHFGWVGGRGEHSRTRTAAATAGMSEARYPVDFAHDRTPVHHPVQTPLRHCRRHP